MSVRTHDDQIILISFGTLDGLLGGQGYVRVDSQSVFTPLCHLVEFFTLHFVINLYFKMGVKHFQVKLSRSGMSRLPRTHATWQKKQIATLIVALQIAVTK